MRLLRWWNSLRSCTTVWYEWMLDKVSDCNWVNRSSDDMWEKNRFICSGLLRSSENVREITLFPMDGKCCWHMRSKVHFDMDLKLKQ